MRHSRIDAKNDEAYELRYADRARARALVTEARAEAEAIGYEFGAGVALLVQGALSYHARDEGATDLALAAHEILRRYDEGGGAGGKGSPGYDEARAHALVQNLLSVHHCVWGSYDTMIEHLRVALEIAGRIGDRATEALATSNMAVANERVGDYPAAIRYYDDARRLAEETGDEFRAWVARAYRAETLTLARRYDEALPELLAAREASVLGGTQIGCEVATSLANLYQRLGRYAEARELLDCARESCQEGDHFLVACGIEEVAGRICAAEGRDVDAIAHFRLACEISRRHDNVANRAPALRGIVDACTRLGRHEEALSALDELVGLRDTLLTDRSADRTRALSVAHRLEWDRREAALVRAQNEELTAVNARLQALLGEKEELHERVMLQATTDELTGIDNRRATAAAGRAEFERHRRGSSPLSVAILDLDGFKGINDRFGHAAGDEVLRRVANVCAEARRLCDAFGRWGGEEFLFVLPGIGLEGAVEAAERFRAAIAGTAFGDILPAGSVTASFGVAEAVDHGSFDALVQTADRGLYRAKREGRDRVCRETPRRSRGLEARPHSGREMRVPALG